MKKTLRGPAAIAVAATLLLAACGGSDDEASGKDTSTTASTQEATQLADVCPATVVVQLDWEPESDYAGVFNMLGKDYTVDTKAKRVTGTLVDADGADTGVKLEIRSGGAAIGFQSVSSQMYTDKDILLGTVSTDQAITAAAEQPVVHVAAIQRWSPYILFWDPKTYPDVKTLADLGKTDAPVVVAKTTSFQDWLVGEGIISADQVDTGYDGTNTRFVTDPSVVMEGYATNSAYVLEKETPAWNKPVEYQLLKDAGYEMYPSALSVRSEDVAGQADCLKKLVPIYQTALRDYMAEPAYVNETVVKLVDEYQTSWLYTKGQAEYAHDQFEKHELVSNETDGALASFDMERQERNVKDFVPVLTKSGAAVPKGLTAKDLTTTEFIDPEIALP